jgi:AcrR family transcriptional regulator
VPRSRNPDVAPRLLDAAARILAEEGVAAVTARRLGSEVGTSTMAVYTHFGGMEELLLGVWREGFVRFGAALEGPATTDDAVADLVTQGWAYRQFALDNRHLYRVMFGDGLIPFRFPDPDDQAVAEATFESLLTRLRRCADAGRLHVEDLELAGQIVWSTVHGHVTIELTGYFDAAGRDPETIYEEHLRRLALAYGDKPEHLATSIKAARRRRRRTISRR